MIRKLLGHSTIKCVSLCHFPSLSHLSLDASQHWKHCLVGTLATNSSGCSQVFRKSLHWMYIIRMDLLLLCRAPKASFQTKTNNVGLPPVPGMTTTAQRAPSSSTTSQKRGRTETPTTCLPRITLPGTRILCYPRTGKWRNITRNYRRASTQASRRPGGSFPASPAEELCDSLQKHPPR